MNPALWLAIVAAAGACGVVVGYLAARVRHGAALAAAYSQGFNLAMQSIADMDDEALEIPNAGYSEERVTIH